MPTITDQAVCIRHWDFSETSQTVSMLTRDHGIVRGLAKGAKRERGDFSGGIDLLTEGQLVAIVKPGRDLATLTAWHLQQVYSVLRRSLAANRAALYMADLVHRMLSPEDPHPRLFDQLLVTLGRLESGDDVAVTLLRFQWALLESAGYRPELDQPADGGPPLNEDAATLAFSAQSGGVVADTGAPDRWRVRAETIALLRGIARGSLPAGATDHESVSRANRLLATYIRDILGVEPAAMRWAFPGAFGS